MHTQPPQKGSSRKAACAEMKVLFLVTLAAILTSVAILCVKCAIQVAARVRRIDASHPVVCCCRRSTECRRFDDPRVFDQARSILDETRVHIARSVIIGVCICVVIRVPSTCVEVSSKSRPRKTSAWLHTPPWWF